MLILLILAAVVVAVLVLVLILVLRKNTKNANSKYNSLVVVKGGKYVTNASQTGKELLYGEYANMGTVMVNVNVSVEEKYSNGYYLCLVQQRTGRQYAAQFMDSLIVGRDPGAEAGLRVEGDGISRRHCRFVATDEGIYVEDLGSSYHTYLNGHDITGNPQYVWSGDEISLGRISYTIYLEKL